MLRLDLKEDPTRFFFLKGSHFFFAGCETFSSYTYVFITIFL